MSKVFTRNCIAQILAQFFKENKHIRKQDVWKRIKGMSRQNFNHYLTRDRAPSLDIVPLFRRAINAEEKSFWAEVRDFYESQYRKE